MSNVLLVPVHLDALVLDSDQMVVEATADFSRLPFCSGKQDINPNIANVSEEIVSAPFYNDNLLLKRGIHLHWSLPDALTKARYNPDIPETQDFPRVPNRWLVTRCNSAGVVEKEWLVESDFLYPPANSNRIGSGVPMPYRPAEYLPGQGQDQPFRYMGRSLQAPFEGREQGQYYPKLTAVGYGEPTFAAFYPNCHSVFGFFDEDYSRNDGRQYYLTGWYNKPDHDVLITHVRDTLLFRPNDFIDFPGFTLKLKAHDDALTQYLHARFSGDLQRQLNEYNGDSEPPEVLQKLLIEGLNKELTASPGLYDPARFEGVELKPETKTLADRRPHGPTVVELNRALLEQAFPTSIAARSVSLASILESEFKWTYVFAEGREFPDRMVCYARLTLGQPKLQQQPNQPVTVAVGNTGTEALSVCVAQRLCGDDNEAQDIVEDQLEAFHLSATLEHRQLDVVAKFEEGRHEKGFTAVPGGTLWTVAAESPTQSPADAANAQKKVQLPIEIGRHLNSINEWQAEYDHAWHEIESLRVQLFSDWYKYMLCAYPPDDTRDAYPDIDEVARYVEKRLAELKKKIAHAGTVTVNEDGVRVVASVSAEAHDAGGGLLGILAAKLAKAINELQAFIDSSNRAGPAYRIKEVSGPRYWRPTEPTILLEGPLATPSNRHGHDGRKADGLLEGNMLPVGTLIDPADQNLRKQIRDKIATIGRTAGESFAFPTWTGQPWNPFLLEWEVEVFPVENQSNIDPSTGRFNEDFIVANYQLAENAVDLALKGTRVFTSAANVYTGRSILTPHAGEQLVTQTETYIERQILPQYFQQANAPAPENGIGDYLAKNIDKIESWYEKSGKSPLLRAAKREEDAGLTAFGAWRQMQKPKPLSQSLGGFNDALLMHKQTLQLHIADPIGFDDYQKFAGDVAKGVNNSIYSAPEPLNDFNPIRSGVMKIHRLRLVDTFGQIKEDLDVSRIVTSDPLDDGAVDPLVDLPPRLMQPARVNFRWLSAAGDQQEMNDHPATTPICGWVLANHLDDSLMIYDNQGKALGSLVKNDANPKRSKWAPAPGGLGVDVVDKITNPHLKKMVTTIRDCGSDFLDDFIAAIDSAVENIEPENFAHHQDLALLMGRPLALVRASVNLELKGLPATHQGWNEFRQDMHREERDDNGFSKVRFPIRIGAYRQFNDGTVGYWKETGPDTYEDDVFFAPQSDEDLNVKDRRHLKTHLTAPDAMVFFQTIQSAPQILSLLIDPRGVVHATTGILPVKAINIPPDQYAAALQAIEITFLSTPILTDAGKIHLPLPDEAGYQWSWLQQDFEGTWSEVSSRGLVRKEAFAEFEAGADVVWKELLDQGWIELLDAKDETRAAVIAKDRRTQTTLDKLKDKAEDIEDILDRAHIGAVNPTAKFSGQQEIREGWLKLSPAQDP